MRIDDRQMYLPRFRIDRSRCRYHRDFSVKTANGITFHRQWQVISPLMHLEHLKYPVRWRPQHAWTICQDHRLQNIHHLSDVGHLDTVRMSVENMKIQG